MASIRLLEEHIKLNLSTDCMSTIRAIYVCRGMYMCMCVDVYMYG